MNREQIFISFAKFVTEQHRDYYENKEYGIIEEVLAMFCLPSKKFMGVKRCVHQENLNTLHDFVISDACTDEQARKVYEIAIGADVPLKINPISNVAGKVFVGMVMNTSLYPDVERLREGISRAIKNTGNEAYFADKSGKSEYIMDGIKENLQNCKFAIIDLTTQNNGAYFEAGYALALGKRVIITCSHEESDKVHFDLRQYRCIFWDNFNKLTEKLTENIVKQGLQAK